MRTALVCLLSLIYSAALAAPTISWDASAGAEGYWIHCGVTPISVAPVPVDAGLVTTFDLGALVTAGVQSECWVTAYAAGVPDSADSNHIQLTPPQTVQTIVIPGQPSSVTVSWQ